MIKPKSLSVFLLSLFFIELISAERPNDYIFKKLNIDAHLTNSNSPQCTTITDEKRVDCLPEHKNNPDQNEQKCMQRQCCWRQSETSGGNAPWCYFPTNYQAYQLTSHKENSHGHLLTLTRHTPIQYPNVYNTIFVDIQYLSENTLRVRFDTDEAKIFVPPIKIDLPTFTQNANRKYEVKVQNNIISVYRKTPYNLVWSADLNTLVLSEQFNQVFTSISSNIVYGLGEHKDTYEKAVKNRKQILFFNRDEPPRPDKALYGHHPFYYEHEINSDRSTKTNAHSVLLLNTHPIELIMMNKPALLWRTLGGTFDFFINMGPSPMEAIQQHVQLVGKPPIVPYWSLGFHLCRFGYDNIETAKEVVRRTMDGGIPLDTMWLDIDFQQDRTMFKVNHNKWPRMRQWIDELKSKDVKFIPIVDPGLDDSYSPEEYPYYQEALEDNAFITHENGDVLKANVWSKGLNGWVDFSSKNGSDFWIRTLKKWQREINFDGLWIDMNEPAQEFDGSDKGCPWQSKYEHPQYIPDGLNSPLAKKTSCMSARHEAGVHYDIHNVYAYYEVMATRQALMELGKRPFIISRGTVTGFGRFGSHWTGDVFSTWEDLQASIPNLLEFNLFGIPVVGADICGFIWDTNEELCSRWHALGAFYTFSRNHNTIGTRDQDPIAMGPVVTRSAKNALSIRYSLLPLLYTELFKSSEDGRPVARALSFEFPDDPNVYGIRNQFLWADKVMIVPVIDPGVRFLNFYMPKGIWYSYPQLDLWLSNSQNGEHRTIELPWENIGVFVRGGNVIPKQKPKQTTTETRQGTFELLVILDHEDKATGELYWDDGESHDIETTKKYSLIEFEAKSNTFTNKVVRAAHPTPNITLLQILKQGQTISKVKVNGQEARFYGSENRVDVLVNLNPTEHFQVEWS